jgi:hypothetical protein
VSLCVVFVFVCVSDESCVVYIAVKPVPITSFSSLQYHIILYSQL